MDGIYRVNRRQVSKEEFLSSAKGIDFSGACAIGSDYAGYSCPTTGKWIEGRKAHRENLKRQGCRLFEKGERQEYIRNKEREIDRNAERVAENMVNAIAHQF